MNEIKLIEERRTGKTTAGILKALAMAIEKPYHEIVYVDHAISENPRIAHYILSKITNMIDLLGLKNITLQKDGRCVIILNKHKGVYRDTDGNLYKRL